MTTTSTRVEDADRIAGLLERVEKCRGADNALDIAIDIALFEPDARHSSVRPNAAGTKLVYVRHDGRTDTHWASDWTMDATGRLMAITRLRSLSQGAGHEQ